MKFLGAFKGEDVKHLSARGQRWLKAIHIFFAAIWVGAGVSLLMMQGFLSATDGKMLYGVDVSMKFVDDFIIIPGAFGSLLSGLAYSLFTPWGFFRHRWVTVKWIINVGGILFGTYWLGPWLNSMPPISGDLGLAALQDPTYTHNKAMSLCFGPIQVGSLVLAVFLSTLKPWKKR